MLRGVTVLPPSINDDESLHSSCTGQRRKGQRARGKGQSGKDTVTLSDQADPQVLFKVWKLWWLNDIQ